MTERWSQAELNERANLLRQVMLDTAAEQFTELRAARARIAALIEERDRAVALWEGVGQHIDTAAIGYNAPQIAAVFAENMALRRERDELNGSLVLARARFARLAEKLEEHHATILHIQEAAKQLQDPSLTLLIKDILTPETPA